MKKNINRKHIDQSKEKISNISGFMSETPICFDYLKLGTLRINFDLKKEITSPNEMSKNRMLFIHLVDELVNYVPFLRKKLESDLGLRFKYSEQIDLQINRGGRDIFTLFMTMPLYGGTKGAMSQLGIFLYEKEDEIFKLIKLEGPIILCHPAFQKKILEWLSDRDIARVKMNNLKNSLLEYALGILKKDRLTKKVGRPRKDSIKKMEKSRIGLFYYLLTFLFRKIKKNRENYKKNSIKEIIEHAGKDLFISFSKIQRDREVVEALKELDKTVSKYEEKFYRISYGIEKDEYLKRIFYRFKWQPNMMAKEIIAKILDVSVSTIESILYRKD